jgi:hypothetical protein
LNLGCDVMKVKVVSKDVGAGKMVPKCELPNNTLHVQGLNCISHVCELEDHVGEKNRVRIGQQSLGSQKKLLL